MTQELKAMIRKATEYAKVSSNDDKLVAIVLSVILGANAQGLEKLSELSKLCVNFANDNIRLIENERARLN